MTQASAVVNRAENTVTYAGTAYAIQLLAPDTYAVLLAGVPVGRIVYTFGAANGVPEGDSVSEAVLEAIGEAWFAALES